MWKNRENASMAFFFVVLMILAILAISELKKANQTLEYIQIKPVGDVLNGNP